MVGVRGVLLAFAALVAVALAALLAMLLSNRRRAWAWRSLSRGAAMLGLTVAAAGAWALVSFDSVFLVFLLVAFPQGNFAFDPRIERLVQLFPEQEAKLDLICRKLRLAPDGRLLDIGCGWGSLILFAAGRYGAEAVGVTQPDLDDTFVRGPHRYGHPAEEHGEHGGHMPH